MYLVVLFQCKNEKNKSNRTQAINVTCTQILNPEIFQIIIEVKSKC